MALGSTGILSPTDAFLNTATPLNPDGAILNSATPLNRQGAILNTNGISFERRGFFPVRCIKLAVGDKPGIAKKKATNAVTANFVHSIDAAHLQLVALAADREGINLVTVHDCFGATASQAARLNEIIREEFVRLHKRHNLLIAVREAAMRCYFTAAKKSDGTHSELVSSDKCSRANRIGRCGIGVRGGLFRVSL
jgi:hypothetical protein